MRRQPTHMTRAVLLLLAAATTATTTQLHALLTLTAVSSASVVGNKVTLRKHDLSLHDIKRLQHSEFHNEKNERVFEREVELAWDEIRLLSHSQNSNEMYPFLACHSDVGLSGYDRRMDLAKFLGISSPQADAWQVLSNKDEKTCFIAALDIGLALLKEEDDALMWSNFRAKGMTLVPYTMHMKIRPHDNTLNTKMYRILTVSLCNGVFSNDDDFAATSFAEDIIMHLKNDTVQVKLRKQLVSKIIRENLYDTGAFDTSDKYRRALVDEELSQNCLSLNYIVSQGPIERSFLFEVPLHIASIDCESFYLAIFSSHNSVCSVSSFDYIHEVALANYEAQWIMQSGVPNYRPFWNKNLRGADEIVGVVDDGLDTNNCYFYDPALGDINKDGSFHANARKVVQYASSNGNAMTIDNDHGTFIAVSQ